MQGVRYDTLSAPRSERLELEKERTGNKRRVNVKIGVFGGYADKRDDAPFDVGQQGVLLGVVEVVDLVEKEDRLFSGSCAADRLACSMIFRISATPIDDGVRLFEMRIGLACDDAGQGAFARPRRAVEI